jgi:hypothetical protein
MEHICALRVVMHLMVLAISRQREVYAAGNTFLVPGLDALFQLHHYIRWGVCEHTRTVDPKEMPDLTPLLWQLPPSYRLQLEAAIVLEQVGHVLSPRARAMLTEQATGQLPRSIHRVAQG